MVDLSQIVQQYSSDHSTFSYLGDSSHAFVANGTTQARFDDTNHILQIDSAGTGTADMEIQMNNVTHDQLTAANNANEHLISHV